MRKPNPLRQRHVAAHRPRPGTVKQAAEILGCNPRTVQRYERAGQLQAIRISPRCIRFDLRQVERLAEQGAAAVKIGGAE
jgi:excisionase family DNA binding protein